jgi:hypothetical protein
MIRPLSLIFVLVSVLAFAGCSGQEGLGRVSGVVTLDDKPLPNAAVEFTPVDGKGLTSYGKTDSNGAYVTMATRTDKGSAVGENKVRITTYDILDEGGKQTRIPEKVPLKYNESTELKADVKSGSNTFNFDLKTEGKIVNKRDNPRDS